MVNPGRTNLWNSTYLGILIFITTLESAIKQNHKEKDNCDICGKDIRQLKGPGNRLKYCKECAKTVNRIKRRIAKYNNREDNLKYNRGRKQPIQIRGLMKGMNLPREAFKPYFTRIIFCENCDKLVENIQGYQKYCEECSIIKHEIIGSRIYQHWANKIKARDKCCKICGSIDNLEAHHILPKIQYPEHARSIANGITLCDKCHRIEPYSIHRILGHIYTREQWATWMHTAQASQRSLKMWM